jgi:hypothetical protein
MTFWIWRSYLLLLLQNVLQAKIRIAIPNQIIIANTAIQIYTIMTVNMGSN